MQCQYVSCSFSFLLWFEMNTSMSSAFSPSSSVLVGTVILIWRLALFFIRSFHYTTFVTSWLQHVKFSGRKLHNKPSVFAIKAPALLVSLWVSSPLLQKFPSHSPFWFCRWWSSRPRWTRPQTPSPGTDRPGKTGNTQRETSVQTEQGGDKRHTSETRP